MTWSLNRKSQPRNSTVGELKSDKSWVGRPAGGEQQ